MVSAAGKICLVTGATSGTGYVTALELAWSGATVVVLARNAQKAARTRDEIIATTGNTHVDTLICDLSEMAQVRHAAEEFKERFRTLDILINNAGGVVKPPRRTSEGLEAMFAGNYLGHFFLTELLLDELKASGNARVINVSSIAHRTAKIDFESIHPNASHWGGYGQSKLAQILFTYELADRLKGDGVTVNALHPGAVKSGFTAEFRTGLSGVIVALSDALIGISPEEGASTILYLAVSSEVTGTTGRYFVKSKEKTSSRRSRDIALRRRLWRESQDILREVGVGELS
jgi:NAD(P)-dependent dehydrogenase (short-subunit alcohol dehydrogenase family)